MQMIAFSSLDIVEDVMVGTGSMYLKMIDKFNEWNVSAFVAPSGERSACAVMPQSAAVLGLTIENAEDSFPLVLFVL